MPTRRVVILAGPDTLATDVTGPADVFSLVGYTQWTPRPGVSAPYKVELVSLTDRKILTTTSGIRIEAHRTWQQLDGRIDTLLIAGGVDVMRTDQNPKLLDWIHRRAKHVRRVGSICTGAFLLASAGLLDGKRVTTHWRFVGMLQKRHPRVTVDPDPIYVRDGNIFTSAGVSAGVDLALAMVEEDHGPRVALDIARDLVLYLRRTGGQAQFSSVLSTQTAERDVLKELQGWILDHLHQPLTVETLASRVSVSPRHLSRLFIKELGATPARFVENLRVEAARRNLEESRAGVKEIANHCGFGSAESMRRSFQRVLRIPPSAYRARFS